MKSNRLQLNTSKTEVLWCAHQRRLHQLPNELLRIGCDTVQPVQQVRDLGIFVDGGLTMAVHVSKTVASCFAVLRSRYAAYNGLSAGRCYYLSSRHSSCCAWIMEVRILQAFPSTYWTVCSRFTEPASTTTCLHCFRNCTGFLFLNTVLVFRCQCDMAPEYMVRDLQWAADTDSKQRLRSSSSQQLIVLRTRLFTVGDRAFGAAAARIWNSLPPTVTSAATLNSFRKHVKPHLFHCSYSSL